MHINNEPRARSSVKRARTGRKERGLFVEGNTCPRDELIAGRGIEHLLPVVSDLTTESLHALESMSGLYHRVRMYNAASPERPSADHQAVFRRLRLHAGVAEDEEERGDDVECGRCRCGPILSNEERVDNEDQCRYADEEADR